MTNSVARPSSSSKALPKAKLAPKKGHGHCLVVCCPTDPLHFLNPGETITSEKYAQQIEKMQWKLHCLKLATTGQQTGPNCALHNQRSRSWTKRATKFCLICRIHHVTSCQPSTTSSSISTKIFAGKTLPQPAGGRKCFPRVHWIPNKDLYITEINLFLVGKNVLIVMVPILSNKDVFEPSYNDLKFMVWNP